MTTTTDTTIPVVSTLTTVTEDVVATATPVMPVPRVRGAVAASAAKVEAPKVFKLGVHAVLTANVGDLTAGQKVFISSVSPLQVSDKEGRTVTVAPEQIKTMKGRPCKVPATVSVAPVVAASPVMESAPPVVASLEAVVEAATVVTDEVSAAVDEAVAEALMESLEDVPAQV
jgi:hypothetical protein